ncbi:MULTISPECIES: hypothetical protein [unclassified Bradyrhizobium]|nr:MULTISPECIES: hypothetical protein [unclassified Bradyrhizobium]MCK1669673.1 hypothetical protein [Bradyrhizobium sp. 153]MCK1757513.1 hypothetical protein [Bradyrhizobium sp. 137]
MADIGKAIARLDGAQARHSETARRSFASFKFVGSGPWLLILVSMHVPK